MKEEFYILLSNKVEVKLNSRNINYYENLGYDLPKYIDSRKVIRIKRGTIIQVKIEDLTKGSNALVNVKCDCEDCKNPYLKPMHWGSYVNHVHADGKYYCNKCSQKLYAVENGRKTKLKNSKSFYDWCYENLSKEEADIVMGRWDYKLNIDKYGNNLSPKDVSYGSMGFDKKGYWFKCLKCHEHKSELKSIKSFVGGQKGSLNCIQCNTIIVTHPHLIKYLKNKEDAYKYSYGSSEDISMICPDCGHKKETNLNRLIKQGFSCPKCGDGISYPEKFMFNFLEQLLNNDFQAQLSKKDFKWCDKYRYDFYSSQFNCIIETHGLYHYEGGFERIKNAKNHIKSLKEVQENDDVKEILAKENNIKNYIVLDCRYSTLDWIKNSIMNSELPKLLNFKEEDIDWNKCDILSCSSNIKIACEHWNNGIKNTYKIANLMKLDKSTIIRYLKKGVELEWCDYDPKIASLNKKYKYTKVICLNTKEIINSIKEASEKYNVPAQYISKCCCGRSKSAGNLPDGTKLRWMYYDEYLKIIS